MQFVGHIGKGYTPFDTDLVLGDGRVVGPFESLFARDRFEQWFGSKCHRLHPARDIFEEAVTGEEYNLLDCSEFGLETHPFTEIYDIWTEADNGKVVFEMPRGFSVVDGSRIVFVDAPQASPPKRRLPNELEAPDYLDVDNRRLPVFSVKSSHHGEIAVFESDGVYTVCWRRDGRQTKDMRGISLHSHEKTAVSSAKMRALDFVPGWRKSRNKTRDGQREALYLWEHSFACEFERFDDISQASELAERICSELGAPSVTVKRGRANLLTKSYYQGDEIVLNKDMVDNLTVIHEVAHHVTRYEKLPREASHGPSFAGVLLALLVHYADADTSDALAKAKERNVVVNLDLMRAIAARLPKSSPHPSTVCPNF